MLVTMFLLQACGLEMLLCAVGGVRREGEVGKGEDVSSDPRWTKFIATLHEKGYFQVSLPHLSWRSQCVRHPLTSLSPPSFPPSLPPLRVRWKAPSCTSGSWLWLETTSLTISFIMRGEEELGGRRMTPVARQD